MATVQLRLPLVKDGGSYVDVRDQNGVTRSFRRDRSPWLQIDREAGTVLVEVDEAAWEKRTARVPEVKAARKSTKKVKRTCLNCRHSFKADPAHRICPPCKKTAAWRSGGDFEIAL